MTAQIKQIVTHRTTSLEVATQDYELAKDEVEAMLRLGYHRMPHLRERFDASTERRAEARKRWLLAMGA